MAGAQLTDKWHAGSPEYIMKNRHEHAYFGLAYMLTQLSRSSKHNNKHFKDLYNQLIKNINEGSVSLFPTS